MSPKINETKYINRNRYIWKICAECGKESWISPRSKCCSISCGNKHVMRRTHNFTHAEYTGAHNRVYKWRGKPDKCINGCIADKYCWANQTGDYWNLADYEMMCYSCNNKMNFSRKEVGHEQ